MLTSSLRYLLGGHPEPLLVELLVGAVCFDLRQRSVDGLDEQAVFGESYSVLVARRDRLDVPDLPVVLRDLLLCGGEGVDHAFYLAGSEIREGLPDGPVRFDLPHLPVVVEVLALELARRAGLDADGRVSKVVDRSDLRIALDQERLVGVEVGVREVYLLLALRCYGHRRDGRVEQVGVEPAQDAIELDVLVLDLEAGPPSDLVHQVDVEPFWPALGGELEGRVGDVGGDRDLPSDDPGRAHGLVYLRASLVGLVGSRAAAGEE